MSKNQNIENLLKDKLNNQEFEIQENWLENMSSQIDDFNEMNEEPKRKKGFIYLILALLLIGGSVVGVLNKKTNQKNIITKNTEVIDAKNEEAKINTSKNKQEVCIENEYFSTTNTQSNSKEIENSNTTKANTTLAKNKSNKEHNSLKKSFNTLANSILNEENKRNEVTNSETISNNESNILTNTKTIESSKFENNLKNNETALISQENSNITKNNNNSKTNIVESVKASNDNKSESNSNHNKTELTNKKDKEFEIINTEAKTNSVFNIEKQIELNNSENNSIDQIINSSNIEDENTEELKNDSIPNNESILTTDSPIIVKNTEKIKGFNFTLKAGPSFLMRNFNSKNSKRNKEETNLLTWNAGVEVNKTFGKFIIGTGLHMSNYGENVNYKAINYNLKDSSYIKEDKTIYHRTISNETGALVVTTDSITHITESLLVIKDSTYLDKYIETENGKTNFTYVEIPIQFGYKIIDTKKFDIDMMTGISTGFLLKNKGSYLNSENKLEKANSNKIIFNYLLSADIKYMMYKNVNLVISPNFKYNLNNLSTVNATRKKYSSFGVQAGINLEF